MTVARPLGLMLLGRVCSEWKAILDLVKHVSHFAALLVPVENHRSHLHLGLNSSISLHLWIYLMIILVFDK